MIGWLKKCILRRKGEIQMKKSNYLSKFIKENTKKVNKIMLENNKLEDFTVSE